MADAVITCSVFAGHVGTTFSLGLPGGGSAPVTLVEASRQRSTQTSLSPFYLVFRSISDDTWPPAHYHLSHPVMGEIEIMLAPFRRVERGMDYTATFD